jgi:hypothetical protein
MTRGPESAVIRACLEYLRLRGVFCWRQNSGALATPGGGFMRAADINGAADIIGVLPGGRFLAAECKSAGGRQSPAQKAFQEAVEKRGGLYVLARSIGDLERFLEEK